MVTAKLLLYRRMFAALPQTHKTFLYLVLTQCLYIVLERSYVLATTYDDGKSVAVWFFIVVMLSVAFVLYFAFHAVLHVNVSYQRREMVVEPTSQTVHAVAAPRECPPPHCGGNLLVLQSPCRACCGLVVASASS